jgi:hypothetical protein
MLCDMRGWLLATVIFAAVSDEQAAAKIQPTFSKSDPAVGVGGERYRLGDVYKESYSPKSVPSMPIGSIA